LDSLGVYSPATSEGAPAHFAKDCASIKSDP
jgi:hypothetical protein